MKSNSKQIKIACLSALGLLILSGAMLAGRYFFPASAQEVRAGDEISISITAAQVSDMYAYQFDLNFDNAAFEYTGGLVSSISEINTIFAKEFDDHLRVGATKIGDVDGFTDRRAAICEVTLTAKKDGELSDISIANVNVVTSELDYLEDIMDWTHSVRVKS